MTQTMSRPMTMSASMSKCNS